MLRLILALLFTTLVLAGSSVFAFSVVNNTDWPIKVIGYDQRHKVFERTYQAGVQGEKYLPQRPITLFACYVSKVTGKCISNVASCTSSEHGYQVARGHCSLDTYSHECRSRPRVRCQQYLEPQPPTILSMLE